MKGFKYWCCSILSIGIGIGGSGCSAVLRASEHMSAYNGEYQRAYGFARAAQAAKGFEQRNAGQQQRELADAANTAVKVIGWLYNAK
jgi:hypothetical protein